MFKESVDLNKETINFINSRMKSEKFFKGQLIYTQGSLCDRIYVIKKGLVRGFYMINNIEVTTWVSTENEIFTSISGFFSQRACKESIESLEDTFVDYLNFDDLKEAFERFADFSLLNKRLMEEYYESAEIRSIMTRIPGAKERITYFLKNYKKEIITRTPKKILASLLNMRPETLSRHLKSMDLIT